VSDWGSRVESARSIVIIGVTEEAERPVLSVGGGSSSGDRAGVGAPYPFSKVLW